MESSHQFREKRRAGSTLRLLALASCRCRSPCQRDAGCHFLEASSQRSAKVHHSDDGRSPVSCGARSLHCQTRPARSLYGRPANQRLAGLFLSLKSIENKIIERVGARARGPPLLASACANSGTRARELKGVGIAGVWYLLQAWVVKRLTEQRRVAETRASPPPVTSNHTFAYLLAAIASA